jgi:formate hydrogenlyase subunit 3/multisubunit Na+/H+ antiporter MnhD subunit
MTDRILLLPIIIPLFCAIPVLFIPKKLRGVKESVTILALLFNVLASSLLFKNKLSFSLPWMGFGLDFSLRLDHFSGFIVLAICAFGFLVSLYSAAFMRGREKLNQFYSYFLFTCAFANGAVLADNLILLLFFWEGLLLSLFGMIAIGNHNAFKTATKAFIIVGITDLCMMVGIALTGNLAGTMTISKISLSLSGLAGLAFILLVIGAISKAGSMPFHSWIPDAAVDAPLPFMALVPGAFEKLVGIYFLTRICLDIFKLGVGSWASMVLMVVGSITIIFAVMMALIQKDYKRLLSYHAISQVGYMILGIGTLVPAGIVGGLFHMLNNALYKSCLFLTAGAVEKQAGTTDLEKLGGLRLKMPLTFLCFVITALSISGVPPFNGFFSKELIYDGALERGWIFYLAAVCGSFFTAASFLKLGHAAFIGRLKKENQNTEEAPYSMLFPMLLISFACVGFGIYNSLPINSLIRPVLGAENSGAHDFSGMPKNMALIIVTVVVLIGALLNHLLAVKRKGSALRAADHIHYAPVLSAIYDRAEKRFFDPYEIGLKVVLVVSKISWWIDRSVDWIYDGLSFKAAYGLSRRISRLHNGNYSRYMAWSVVGVFLVISFLIYSIR